LLSTETPSYFLLLIVEVFIIIFAGLVVVVVVMGALALPCLWKVFRSGFSIIDGLRPVTGRPIRRGIFVV
jgi:hypothetical protein